VFLGGMFWFIYQDLDNLNKPWFMHALGFIAIAFAFFWLLIPMMVVWLRIRRRWKKNREHYAQWRAAGGVAALHPSQIRRRPDGGKGVNVSSIENDIAIYSHEKGTLYVALTASQARESKDDGRTIGRPSDVAFPGFKRKCAVSQRTHCYFTDRRVAFAGKDLDMGIPFESIKSFSTSPGGLVFVVNRDGAMVRMAFTFQNPLVMADVLRHLVSLAASSAKA
jgi:hypothetical protein